MINCTDSVFMDNAVGDELLTVNTCTVLKHCCLYCKT